MISLASHIMLIDSIRPLLPRMLCVASLPDNARLCWLASCARKPADAPASCDRARPRSCHAGVSEELVLS